MNEISVKIADTIKSISDGAAQTTTAIAKIKEIERTTGISKQKSKRLLRESETNLKIADQFKKWCENNPGIYYEMTIGNAKISNIGQILQFAQNEFIEEEIIPENEDNEWLLKFLDVARETSDVEKQKLLSKVLAGEMRKPNSISYRTLRILKDMSRNDLVLFRRAISCCFNYNNELAFIPQGESPKDYLSVAEIMYINECGLFDNGDKVFRFTSERRLTTSGKKYMVILKPKNDDEKCELPCIYLTESGMELFRLMNVQEADVEILKNYLKKVKGLNSKFYGSLHEWSYKKDDLNYYNREDILIK